MTTKMSLVALARQELAKARAASNGRSATTVHGGHERVLRQTLIALRAGHQLDEHESPGEATVQVIEGRIRLRAASDEWAGMTGDLLVVPNERHSLAADEDAVVLLTVAKTH